MRIYERNNSAEPKVSAEGGQEVLQVPEQKFPAAVEQTIVKPV